MKKSLIALFMAGTLAGLSSCGTARNATGSIKALDGEWKITEVDGQGISSTDNDNEAFIGLDVKEMRLYGSTSCNRLLGGFEADAKKGTISFGQTGSTRMMCPDMETERKVLDAIGKVTKYEIAPDGKMAFKSADGTTVMKLEKK